MLVVGLKNSLLSTLSKILQLPAEPLRRAIFTTTFSIFELWSRLWRVTRLLGLHGVPPRPHPLKGVW